MKVRSLYFQNNVTQPGLESQGVSSMDRSKFIKSSSMVYRWFIATFFLIIESSSMGKLRFLVGHRKSIDGKLLDQRKTKEPDLESISSKVSYWARNGGGGDIWVLLCSQRGGGGHEKFFRKVDSFWRFGKSGGKRQKLSPFRKIFSCPPPLRTQ